MRSAAFHLGLYCLTMSHKKGRKAYMGGSVLFACVPQKGRNAYMGGSVLFAYVPQKGG